MGLLLGGFHYMMTRRLLGVQLCIWTDGRWEYYPLEGALKAAGIEIMYTYIYRHQNTVA